MVTSENGVDVSIPLGQYKYTPSSHPANPGWAPSAVRDALGEPAEASQPLEVCYSIW